MTPVLSSPATLLASGRTRPPLRLSATSYGLWSQCQRKWAFTFNEGHEQYTGATAMGTRIHKILEEYLTLGKAPDLLETFKTVDKKKLDEHGLPVVYTYYPGQIAQSGIGFLPPPGSILCEVPFTVKTQSITWQGQVDGKYRDGKTHLPVVLDHKSTTDKKWTKTPEILATDPQGVLYPHALSVETGEPVILDRWVYYLTKLGKYDSWVSEYVSTFEARQPVLDAMDRAGVEMLRAYESGAEALSFPPTPSQCEKFGVCPHKDTRCVLTLTEILLGDKGTMNQVQGESLEAFMARQEAGTPAALPGPAIQPPGRPPYWIEGDPMSELQQYMASKGKPLYAIASAADVPPPAEVLNEMMRAINPHAAPVPTTNPGVINPPEAPKFAPALPMQMPPVLPTPPQSAGFAPPPVLPSTALGPPPVPQGWPPNGGAPLPGPSALPPIQAPTAAPAQGPAPTALPQGPAPTALPTGIGAIEMPDTIQDAFTGVPRETLKQILMAAGLVEASSKMREDGLRAMCRQAAAKGLISTNPNIAIAGHRSTGTVMAPLPTEASTGRGKNLGLFIGCLQIGLETVTLADFLTPILAEIQKQTGLPHWGLEDFGKGSARLAAAVEAWLLANPNYNASIFVEPRSSEAQACLPVLLRYAEVVTRATF